MVEILPLVSTLRIRLLKESATYKLPAASNATPAGNFNCAAVAAPPSPANPAEPVPATVLIVNFGACAKHTDTRNTLANPLRPRGIKAISRSFLRLNLELIPVLH